MFDSALELGLRRTLEGHPQLKALGDDWAAIPVPLLVNAIPVPLLINAVQLFLACPCLGSCWYLIKSFDSAGRQVEQEGKWVQNIPLPYPIKEEECRCICPLVDFRIIRLHHPGRVAQEGCPPQASAYPCKSCSQACACAQACLVWDTPISACFVSFMQVHG